MNIIFFGSSSFSIPILKALLKPPHHVLCVVTTPDRKKGRGQVLTPNEVKVFCESQKIECLSPEKLRDEQFQKILSDKKPDFLVVASYGKMIPETVFKLPRYASLNVHPSLLPLYRGASPIQSALLAGDQKTGISIAEVTKDLDAGDLFGQIEIPIEINENASDLLLRLADLAAALILKIIGDFESGKVQKKPQDHSGFTYAAKLEKDMGAIDWSKPAAVIHNLIRACHPWPSAFTFYKGKRLKILSSKPNTELLSSGKPSSVLKILKDGSVCIGTGTEPLLIVKVQPEGRKEMSAADFVRGERLKEGDLLASS